MSYPVQYEVPEPQRAAELLRMLRRQRWIVAAILLVGTAAGVSVAVTRVPMYEATAVLRVDEKRLGLPSLDAAVPFATGNQIGTELEVLRSRELAGSVVDALGLRAQVRVPRDMPRDSLFTAVRVDGAAPAGEYRLARRPGTGFAVTDAASGESLGHAAPGEPVQLPGAVLHLTPRAAGLAELVVAVLPQALAVTELRERLRVRQPARETGVIHITYSGPDAGLVERVPNELSARFLEQRHRTSRDETRGTIEYLRRQLDTIAVELALTERELQTFRETERVVDLQAERSAQILRLGGMQAERDALEAERTALAGLIDEVRAADTATAGGPTPFRRLVAFPALLRNQAASDLVRSLVNVEDERAALVTRRRPTDPEMVMLDARIRDLEDALKATVTTYLAGLTNQVGAIDAQLSRYTNDLAGIPAKEVRFAQLSRRAKLQEEVYGQLQTRLTEAEVAQSVEDLSVRIIDRAAAELRPLRLKQALIVSFAVVLSLLLGVGTGLAREYLDDSVHSRFDLASATGGLPVLGTIPQILHNGSVRALPAGGDAGVAEPLRVRGRNVGDAPALLIGSGTPPLVSEAYQRLQMNVLWAGPESGIHSVLFTSPLPGEGKTTTAVNFAAALARRGQSVILLDMDLRRATMSSRLHAQRAPGVADLLAAIPPPAFELVRTLDLGGGATLDFIPAGDAGEDPGPLLERSRLTRLLAWATSSHDVVVIDSPPAGAAADALLLGSLVDGVILVTRASVTPADAVAQTVQEFRAASVTVLGTVLNDVRMSRDATYDSSYRYYGSHASYYGARRAPATKG